MFSYGTETLLYDNIYIDISISLKAGDFPAYMIRAGGEESIDK